MDMDNIFKPDKKDVVITLRISEDEKKFIDENNLSPSALFREFLGDLKESTLFKERRKMQDAWTKSLNKGKERFSVCNSCKKIYLGKTEELEKGIRVCKKCGGC